MAGVWVPVAVLALHVCTAAVFEEWQRRRSERVTLAESRRLVGVVR